MAETLMELLTNDDGTSIRLDRLAALVTGIIATAFGDGMANLIEGLFQAFLISPLQGVSGFIRSLTTTVTTGLGDVERGVWSALNSFLRNFGPFAYWVAVLFILALAYLLVKGRDWSG
ncbi:hypothetical protein [Haladaptatus sp. DYF46]|uniref:hypothetical protein n=1 Tax=Haladaptatus sp. DYF46 TaxID=2886041 RepID=UPI001E469770|nr:hypothetical protein [Haladaptatus sp. DYF46]